MKKMHPVRKRTLARAVLEPLENRQLLSAVIDLRLADGTKTATVTSVGQTVNVDVWAVVTGKDATGSNDGFQEVFGSFVSTQLTSGSIKGNLTAANVAPFNGGGSSPGTPTDLNNDGSLDVGSNDSSSADGFFFARAGAMQTSGGTVSGASQSFKIGTLTYTVASLSAGSETDVNVVPRNTRIQAVWNEDGVIASTLFANVLSVGTPVRISSKPVVAPAGTISGSAYKDLNGDGIKEGGEAGLANVTVYIDANKNGVKDAGEMSTTTGSSGTYSFTGLSSGTYRVAEVSPANQKLTRPTAGHYDVTVSSTTKITGKNFFNQPTAAVVVTVDNSQATKTGVWTALTSPSGFVGSNYLSDGNTGKGTKSVTYKASLPSSGTYLVYARWVAGSNRATNVPIDIHASTGTATVKVNQQINGGQWVLLGTYSFSTLTGATIVVRNAGTAGVVVADAIQLVKLV